MWLGLLGWKPSSRDSHPPPRGLKNGEKTSLDLQRVPECAITGLEYLPNMNGLDLWVKCRKTFLTWGHLGLDSKLKHGPKILWCCTGTVSSLSHLKSCISHQAFQEARVLEPASTNLLHLCIPASLPSKTSLWLQLNKLPWHEMPWSSHRIEVVCVSMQSVGYCSFYGL